MLLLVAALKLALHVFGPGPVLNIPPFTAFNDAALTNASAHTGWATLVPLGVGKLLGRRAGMWAGIGYCCAAVLFEATLHNSIYGVAGGPEVRTDILTHCVPALLVALWHGLARSADTR